MTSPRNSAPPAPRAQTVTRAPTGNPFTPATKVEPKGKMLLFGGTGTGKTHFGLTCPGRVAIVDTEGGTAFFAGRVPEFDVIPTKSYRDVVAAVEWIEAHPGVYETLVVDPVTVIYEVLQDAAIAARTGKVVAAGGDPADVDIEMREWGRIKRLYKALMTRLVNLPLHVVIIAREKDDVVRQGGEMVKVGVKVDAEKGTAYYFDVVANLVVDRAGKRTATILKDRTGTHATGSKIEAPTFDLIFGKVLAAKVANAPQRHVATDEVAAATDAEAFGMKLASALEAADLVAALAAAGFDPDEVRERKCAGEPFTTLPAAKVAELTKWAKAKAATTGAPVEEPVENDESVIIEADEVAA